MKRRNLLLAATLSTAAFMALASGCSSGKTGAGLADDAAVQDGSGGGTSDGAGSSSGASGGTTGSGSGSTSSGTASNGSTSSGSTSSGSTSSGTTSSGSTSSGTTSSGTTSSDSNDSTSDSGSTTSGTTSSGSSDSGISDSGSSGSSDSGSTAYENEWLVPMNAARAALGEGEPALTWNPIAAEVAQAWASQCMWMHNPNRSSEYDSMGGSGGVGENIAAGSPSQTVAGAVASWVNEKANYTYGTFPNTCAPGDDCGHYTQIIWKTTTSVGCAQVHCTTNSPFTDAGPSNPFYQWDYSVCDYSPRGNFVGETPY